MDEKSLQLLQAMREQLGESTGRTVDAGLRQRVLACTPELLTAACTIPTSGCPMEYSAETKEGVQRPWWRRVFRG